MKERSLTFRSHSMHTLLIGCYHISLQLVECRRNKTSAAIDHGLATDFNLDWIANATISYVAGRFIIGARDEAGTWARKNFKSFSSLTRPRRVAASGECTDSGAIAAREEIVGTVVINWRRLGDRETAGLGLAGLLHTIADSLDLPPSSFPLLLFPFSCQLVRSHSCFRLFEPDSSSLFG